jgi:hypothetical protein
MAYYASPNLLDGGPDYLAANCDLMGVVFEYTFGDSYATVTSNLLASVAIVSGNFAMSSSGNDRVCTTAAGLQDAAAEAGEVSSHIVFLKTTATTEVILVVPETTLVTINVGDPVNFPSIPITWHQPTA